MDEKEIKAYQLGVYKQWVAKCNSCVNQPGCDSCVLCMSQLGKLQHELFGAVDPRKEPSKFISRLGSVAYAGGYREKA